MFSKSCEYAIRATLLIANHSCKNQKSGIKEIAEEINSPVAFTAKILQILTKNKIIKSFKGPTGGFYIEEISLEKIKLSDIVTAIDGDSVFRGCALGLPQCSELTPCPVHDRFKHIREELKQMLTKTSLQDLMLGIDHGLTFLKIDTH
ncbi:Rrf2 family transcriptional regulator [Apibacter sp. HY039]|uniref:RrF2 family transcriptional regulator n=1 Tax=Apibacter sp. HY039 TaxID=2501476 RepID=UPI000FEBAEC1|nr:Rrf2 family transcriptional regulator [Apibacter sp. HY039]